MRRSESLERVAGARLYALRPGRTRRSRRTRLTWQESSSSDRRQWPNSNGHKLRVNGVSSWSSIPPEIRGADGLRRSANIHLVQMCLQRQFTPQACSRGAVRTIGRSTGSSSHVQSSSLCGSSPLRSFRSVFSLSRRSARNHAAAPRDVRAEDDPDLTPLRGCQQERDRAMEEELDPQGEVWSCGVLSGVPQGAPGFSGFSWSSRIP